MFDALINVCDRLINNYNCDVGVEIRLNVFNIQQQGKEVKYFSAHLKG